ncbi:hypothetical protein KAR91_58675 [Candidatus Pacearchaeota archaeon]|nr:hypothetical protein [Candidatus Pacearchaeota archaeon]
MFKKIIRSEAHRIKSKNRKRDTWLLSLSKESNRLNTAYRSSLSPSKKAIRICKTWKEFFVINYRNIVSKTNQYNIRHNHQSLDDRWKFAIISAHNRIRMWYRHRGIDIESKTTFLYDDSNRDWQNLLESAHTNLVKKKYHTGWKKLIKNNSIYIRKATHRSNGSSNKKKTPTKDWTTNLNNQKERLKVMRSTFVKDWGRLIRNTISSLHNRESEKRGRLNV